MMVSLAYSENGTPLARVRYSEDGIRVRVERLPGCSLGTYFRILVQLCEMGYDIE